jgi:hypothetical protein
MGCAVCQRLETELKRLEDLHAEARPGLLRRICITSTGANMRFSIARKATLGSLWKLRGLK